MRNYLPTIGIGILCLLVAVLIVPQQTVLFYEESGFWRIQDFAYHYILSTTFWLDRPLNIYSSTEQIRIISDWFGSELSSSMPVGMTPSFLWALGPLYIFAGKNVLTGYIIWILISSALIIGWVSRRRPQKVEAIAITATLLSPAYFACVELGQTSVGVLALLLWLLPINASPSPNLGRGARLLYQVLALFFLALKPQYFLLAVPILISSGSYRVIVGGSVAVLVSWLLLTFGLTTEWISDYIQNLYGYARGGFPLYHSFWINNAAIDDPEKIQFGISTTSVQTFLYVMFSLFSIVAALGSSCKIIKRGAIPRTSPGPILLAFGAFFLFAPRVGFYENILLVVPTIFVSQSLSPYSKKIVASSYLTVILAQYLQLPHWQLILWQALYLLLLFWITCPMDKEA